MFCPIFLIGMVGAQLFAQGRPPDVPPPSGSDTLKIKSSTPALGKSTADAYPDVHVSGLPRQGETCEVSLAASSAANGPVVVAWVDFRNGTRCGYAASQDGGNTWGAPLIVGPSGGGFTGDAVIGVDETGNFYAACQDYGADQIRFSSSADGGLTWAAWRNVQSTIDKPWIAGARNGTVYLTWLGNTTAAPGGFKRSLDRGLTWVNSYSLGMVYHGTAIGTGNTGAVHILYNQGAPLRYVRSTDWGATLEAGRNIVPDMGTSCYGCTPRQHPVVGGASSPDGRVVAAVWSSTFTGGDGDDDVWAVISRDNGNTWTAPIRVNSNTNASRQFQPWVAVDRFGRVHAVWTDMRNGNNAIFYANTLTNAFGTNVELTDARGTVNGFYGDYKGITIQGDDVLATWADSRNGDNDIYFTRGVGLAGPNGVALEPGTRRYQHAKPWKTSVIFDVQGRGMANGRPKAAGKYFRKP